MFLELTRTLCVKSPYPLQTLPHGSDAHIDKAFKIRFLGLNENPDQQRSPIRWNVFDDGLISCIASNPLGKHRAEIISDASHACRYEFAFWPDQADVSQFIHKLIEDRHDVRMLKFALQ